MVRVDQNGPPSLPRDSHWPIFLRFQTVLYKPSRTSGRDIEPTYADHDRIHRLEYGRESAFAKSFFDPVFTEPLANSKLLCSGHVGDCAGNEISMITSMLEVL